MPSKRDTQFESLTPVGASSSVSDRLYVQQKAIAGGTIKSLSDLIKSNGGDLKSIQ